MDLQEIGDCVLMLEGHKGPLKDMAVAADGSVVVTASEDGTARAWDLVSAMSLSEAEHIFSDVSSNMLSFHLAGPEFLPTLSKTAPQLTQIPVLASRVVKMGRASCME